MIFGMKRITTGTDYEKWCAAYLSRHGFHQIELTKATGDQGIDIIAYKRHRKYGIQCKFYDTPVGNSSVQEAYAGAAFYGCDQAAVMTNTVFTKGAQSLAEETDVLLWPQRDPAAEDRFLKFYRFLRTVQLIAGLLMFGWAAVQTEAAGRDYISVCAILLTLAGCAGFFTERSIVVNEGADLFDASAIIITIHLMHTGIWPADIPWWLGCSVLLILSLFQLVQQYKLRSAHLYELHQQQLEEDMQTQTAAIGEQTGRILQEEMRCHLDCIESRKDGDILVFLYHADKNIADQVAAAEAAVNQDAGMSDHYQILDLGRRKLQVSLHHTDKKESS